MYDQMTDEYIRRKGILDKSAALKTCGPSNRCSDYFPGRQSVAQNSDERIRGINPTERSEVAERSKVTVVRGKDRSLADQSAKKRADIRPLTREFVIYKTPQLLLLLFFHIVIVSLCVCLFVRVGDSGDRQTDRLTQTDTQREAKPETSRQKLRDRQTDLQTKKQTKSQTHRQMYNVHTQTQSQTHTDRNSETDKQSHRRTFTIAETQTDVQTYKQTGTDIHACRLIDRPTERQTNTDERTDRWKDRWTDRWRRRRRGRESMERYVGIPVYLTETVRSPMYS